MSEIPQTAVDALYRRIGQLEAERDALRVWLLKYARHNQPCYLTELTVEEASRSKNHRLCTCGLSALAVAPASKETP